MRAVHFAFGDSVKNPLRFEKIQDRAGTVPGISLHVNIPDVPGKKKDEKRAQKNPRKKGLSLPVSLEKERHAVFAEDPYAGAAFSGCRLQIKKILQRNVQLIRPCSGTQIPESDPPAAAQIQKTFRFPPVKAQPYITFQKTQKLSHPPPPVRIKIFSVFFR